MPKTVNNVQPEEFTPEILQAASAFEKKRYKVSKTRMEIQHQAGDVLSLLGTTSDAVQLLLVAHCELISALSQATTVAQVKQAAVDNTLAPEAVALLTELADGTVKMPHTLKGLSVVMADIKARSTAVTNVLAGSA